MNRKDVVKSMCEAANAAHIHYANVSLTEDQLLTLVDMIDKVVSLDINTTEWQKYSDRYKKYVESEEEV